MAEAALANRDFPRTYGKVGSYFERQIARWTKQYLASQTEDIPAMNQLIEWLPALHDRFGAALLDEILLAADQRPGGLPSTHTSG